MPTPKGILNELSQQCVTESIGLTKREYFAAALPHLEFECRDIKVMSEFIGRDINDNDEIDILKASAEFEAKLRLMRVDAHLAELEK